MVTEIRQQFHKASIFSHPLPNQVYKHSDSAAKNVQGLIQTHRNMFNTFFKQLLQVLKLTVFKAFKQYMDIHYCIVNMPTFGRMHNVDKISIRR